MKKVLSIAFMLCFTGIVMAQRIDFDFSGRQSSDSTLPHEVLLKATVAPNNFGGVHIQHTGSCGESTTMLHHLKVDWN